MTVDVELVEPLHQRYAMVDGVGEPEGEQFAHAVSSLYAVAYGVKVELRRSGLVGEGVAPLEALWGDDGDGPTWTAMIALPPTALPELVDRVVDDLGITDAVRVEWFREGPSVQVLHVGPYADESDALTRLQDFMTAHGLRPAGRHHEIYLGDPRRSAPERLRTIVRQPVAA